MDASERRDAALARPPDPTSRVPLLSPTSLGWDPERLAAHLHHHSFAIAQARSMHWSPYDRVRVVNADP